jgi:hypothetical protein
MAEIGVDHHQRADEAELGEEPGLEQFAGEDQAAAGDGGDHRRRADAEIVGVMGENPHARGLRLRRSAVGAGEQQRQDEQAGAPDGEGRDVKELQEGDHASTSRRAPRAGARANSP